MNKCDRVAAKTKSVIIVVGLGAHGPRSAPAQILFEDPVEYLTASDISGFTVLDVNNDGFHDVIAAEAIESLSLFINDNDGALRYLGSLFEPSTRPTGISSADLDLDGNRDIIWTASRRDSHEVNVLLYRDIGRPGMMQTIALPRRSESLATGDLNGDGWTDVVVLDDRSSDSQLHVFLNNAGELELYTSVELPWIHNKSIILGDFDSDGDLDAAMLALDDSIDYMYGWKLDQSQVRVLLGDGTGAFPTTIESPLPYGGGLWGEDSFPVQLISGDMDGDSDPDLIIAACSYEYFQPVEMVVMENHGDDEVVFTSRATVMYGNTNISASISVSDLNNNGRLDVISRDYEGLWVIRNEGVFHFAEPDFYDAGVWSRPISGAIFDMNLDGRNDVIVSSQAGFLAFQNATTSDGPTLDHPPLKRGTQVALTVADAQPGETVDFLYSLTGAGNSLGQQKYGGLTLDLLDPIEPAGSAVADANGVATINVNISQNTPLMTVVIQAVIARGQNGEDSVKTPFRTARILP